MEHDQDFSALRNLLALRKLETPMDTEINRFLIEFHRRQRAQLLVPQSRWARAMAWIHSQAENYHLVPSLSYASGFAAVALMAFLGFSQQVQVSQTDGQYKLSLNMPSSEATLAMIPTSFVRGSSASPAKTDSLTFTPTASKPGATHFILANTRVAYDATAAF
jgi:hypothetical protein